MRLAVVGAGYVGLVTAAIFSEFGNEVWCVDIDKKKIEQLKAGKVPFFEPSLGDYISRNLQKKRLFFTTSYAQSIPKSQVVFICVGTPPKNNGEADLSYLFSAVVEVAGHISQKTLIVIKSTVPIGFEDDLARLVAKNTRVKFEFAANPEFLREGTAIEDTLHPSRIVIGVQSEEAKKILLELHAPIPGQRVICDMRSAQLIKYASNAFLATKVSFANAIAILCEKMGADVEKVLEGVGWDRRIGRAFLYPGIGYGGSCLPKDVLAFIAIAGQFSYNFDLLRSVDAINNFQIENFINKVRSALGVSEAKGGDLGDFALGILGLSFKPNTDDMRDAPSIKIVGHLQNLGAKITAYDPQAMTNAKAILKDVEYAQDPYGAITEKDAMLVLTEWPQFLELDLKKVKKLLRRPIVVDGRNIYDLAKMRELGFKYYAIGR